MRYRKESIEKVKTPFNRLLLFTGIALCFVITLCNGQTNHRNKQNGIPDKKTIIFPNLENQISNVIPAILQDSKGNIWFGTQNGVLARFKRSNLNFSREAGHFVFFISAKNIETCAEHCGRSVGRFDFKAAPSLYLKKSFTFKLYLTGKVPPSGMIRKG